MPSVGAPKLRACAALLALGVSACEPENGAPASVGAARQLLSTVPLVSQEIDIDAPVLVRSRDNQYRPAAASDGFGYLVVWNDLREGGGIWASRLDAGGTLLDKTGIIVGKGPWGVEPQVAFDGSSYVVLWGSQGATPNGLYAVRVKPDGSVLDNPPITVSLAGGGGQITRGPSGSLAVFNESSSVYVRRIAEDGTLLDGSPQEVASNGYAPDVAFDGSTYLVIWQSGSDLRAARLSHSLLPLDSKPLLVASATGAAWPSVAAGSSGFLVSWSDYSGQVRVSRVKADGSVLDPGGVPLPDAKFRSDAGFDGAAHLVVSTSPSLLGVAGTRVGPAGAPLAEKPLLISSGEGVDKPRVASRPGEHLVVWESAFGGGTPTDISGRRVAADGTLLGAAALDFALSANEQLAPVVASDGTDFLLVWQDHRNPAGPDLYAERVSGAGIVLDPLAIPLASGPKSEKEPEISFDGTHYLLVWEEEDDVRGARVDKTGKPLDAGGFPIASSTSAERDPVVASGGGVSLVAWTHGGSNQDVYAARVDSTGKLLDPSALVVADGAGSQKSAAVASDGSGFCVTWLHNGSSGAGSGGGKLNWGSLKPNYEIRASLIAGDGTPLTSSPVVVVPMGERGVPRVAFGGGIYLVVWADGRNSVAGAANFEIYAARVTTSGTVLDPNGIRVTELPGPDAWPDVSWKGGVFVVAWIANEESRAARIDATGLVLDPGGFILSPVADWGKPIRVASNAAGTTLAGYERYDSAPVFRSKRTRARSITFVAAPDGGITSDAASAADSAAEDAPVLDVAEAAEALDAEPVSDSGLDADTPGALDASGGEAGHAGAEPDQDGTNGLGGSSGGGSSATEPTKSLPDADSGCGCEMPRSTPTSWPLAALALAALLAGCRGSARFLAVRRRVVREVARPR